MTGSFDAVVLGTSTPDRSQLEWVRSILAPDGVVVFERPNRGSRSAKSLLAAAGFHLAGLASPESIVAELATQSETEASGRVAPHAHAATASTDPFEVHRARVAEVLPSGDAAAIKGLYRELGELLDAEFGDDPDLVPALSFPESAPIVAAAVTVRHGLVLDAGCGPNPTVAIAVGSVPGRTVVALDIGEGTAALARRCAAHKGIDLLVVVGDLEHLPFRGAAFAAAVCDDAIEHVPDDSAAAAELARVMQRNAGVVIATPNRWSLQVLVRKVRDRLAGHTNPPAHYYAAASHLREYTWFDLERLLAPHFIIRRRLAVPWTGGRREQLASRFTATPVGRHLSRMVVVEVVTR